MWNAIRHNVIVPAISRIGTVVATWAIAQGVEADLAQQVAVGVTAVGLVSFDFITSYAHRKGWIK